MGSTQGGKEKTRVALLSVASNTLLTSAKIVIGLVSGSVSILSEGIHSALDLLAACIAFFSVKESAKPADSKHAYGHGKIENVSGTIEAMLIFLAVILITIEAVKKLIAILGNNSVPLESSGLYLGMAVMGGSALINIFVSWRLMRVAKRTDSVALKADALHLRTDVYTSAGVFAGLLLMRLTGWHILDPLIALAVALMISRAAYSLIKEAFSPLVDVSLPEPERAIITSVLTQHKDGFLEYHNLRTRKSGSERHVDLHLVVPRIMSVGEVHALCDQIEGEINIKLKGTHILIHAEPCSELKKDCPIEAGLATTCQSCQLILDKEI